MKNFDRSVWLVVKRAVIIRRALVPIWIVNSFLVRRKTYITATGKIAST